MRSRTLKLVSVACALIMLATIFHVAITNASADVPEEQAIDDPLLHGHRRLTTSNCGAAEPSFTISSNGTLHVAWVDLAVDGVRLDHKRSFDNGTTFSPDTPITPVFHSIDSISISPPLVRQWAYRSKDD